MCPGTPFVHLSRIIPVLTFGSFFTLKSNAQPPSTSLVMCQKDIFSRHFLLPIRDRKIWAPSPIMFTCKNLWDPRSVTDEFTVRETFPPRASSDNKQCKVYNPSTANLYIISRILEFQIKKPRYENLKERHRSCRKCVYFRTMLQRRFTYCRKCCWTAKTEDYL